VQQQAADIGEIEVADLGGVEVVDAQLAPRDPRAQGVAGDLEPPAFPLAPGDRGDRLGAASGGPVPPTGLEDVDPDHLLGSAALELEGPEAVEGPDVEAALAGE
jgi:hypothetical protein